MVTSTALASSVGDSSDLPARRRALLELGIAYGLILAVIWSQRPLQRYLWMLAVAVVAVIMARSWPGRRAVGLRRQNFLRSLWIPCAALLLASGAVVAAIHFGTLDLPDPPPSGPASADTALGHTLLFVGSYWGYALWTFVQQFLLQGFFLLRLQRVMPGPISAAFAAANLFAFAHLPNPILTIATIIWGFAACLLFLRYRNLYSLGMAHAIFGITLAITIPGPVIRNMRVGLGYMTYGHHHKIAQSFQPERPYRIH